MPVEIYVPQPVTQARLLQSMEAPGRPGKRVAGGWIADFVSLRKSIMLCPFCTPKFNPRRYNYEIWRRDLYSTARCDGCNQMSRQIKTYIHESHNHETGEPRRPKRGRWATGAL